MRTLYREIALKEKKTSEESDPHETVPHHR